MSITKTDLDKLKKILNGLVISHFDRQEVNAIINKIEKGMSRPRLNAEPSLSIEKDKDHE